MGLSSNVEKSSLNCRKEIASLLSIRNSKSRNLNNYQGRIWGRIQEVGFLSFDRNPTPTLPKLEAVEIMFSFILK